MRRVPFFISVTSLLALLGIPAHGAVGKASIPSGTSIKVRLGEKLETGKTKSGQTFAATVAEPISVGGTTVVPQGARVDGRVIDAVSSGRMRGRASLTLELTAVGRSAVTTEPLRIDGKSHLLRNVELIGGGAAAGALVGAVAGGKKGAAIGAGIGAGAGAVTAYMTGEKEIVLPAELPLTFVIAGGGAGTIASRQQTQQPPAYSGTSREGRRITTQTAEREEGSEEKDERGERRASKSAEGRKSALVFLPRDQEIIREYFRINTSNLPPGLAKRGGNLPPGLKRQLERNGTLPPGLQKRVQPFPEDLSRKLPRLPAGYSRVVLGDRALILDATNTILDLMHIR